MLINIIDKALGGVQVVQIFVRLLSTFRLLAIRPAIQQCLSKKATEVRVLFKKQCQSIRKDFDDNHRNPPLRLNEPKFAGSALWAESLSCRIEEDWSLIKDDNTMGKIEFKELLTLVNDLKYALFSYQSQKYSAWLETLNGMDTESFQELLNQVSCSK